jgi:protoporphyrinogen oxidase
MQIRPKQPIPVAMAKRHVAVVGAGFAGLAAARTLLAEGKGAVTVTLLEADGVVGGRGRRRELASGPVEMGATWFHGTEGNPVFDYAMNLISSSGSGAPGDVQQPQQDKPKDTTANATGNDER